MSGPGFIKRLAARLIDRRSPENDAPSRPDDVIYFDHRADWRPGDLAVCITAGLKCQAGGPAPKLNELCRVDGVKVKTLITRRTGIKIHGQFLSLQGFGLLWLSENFRKAVDPNFEADETTSYDFREYLRKRHEAKQ